MTQDRLMSAFDIYTNSDVLEDIRNIQIRRIPYQSQVIQTHLTYCTLGGGQVPL